MKHIDNNKKIYIVNELLNIIKYTFLSVRGIQPVSTFILNSIQFNYFTILTVLFKQKK